MVELVIETATAACSVALLQDDAVIAARHEVVGRGHAERLVPMIAELLAEASVAQADAILVDCGPGSFTGIRVGLAAARGLGLAWRVPVRGFSSLALLAVVHEGSNVTTAITGGHGEVFFQRFACSPLVPLTELASRTPDAAAASTPDEVVFGTGAEALVAARGWGVAEPLLPCAADVRHLPVAFRELPPTPLYGRAPDAKVPA
jgi:tRNA threonylcarbamoyl adenosine modification protein YeaZ